MRKLTLDDQQTFNQYLANSHLHWQFQSGFIAIPSAYSFSAHYIWRDFYDFFWVTQNDFFCLFARQDGDYFMPIAPFGSRPLGPDIIEWVFRLMGINNVNNINEYNKTASLFIYRADSLQKLCS